MTRAQRSLNSALATPGCAGDAARCRHRIVWSEVDGKASDPLHELVLWKGSVDGDLIHITTVSGVLAQAISQVPAPGYQSFGALRRLGIDFSIHAKDLSLLQALPFMERLLDAWRQAMAGNGSNDAAIDHRGLAAIRGRYLALANAASDWVYTEEVGTAGQVPLLMLHTAGADARQWHGLMSLPALQSDWHVHAFDLPSHGRSPVPSRAIGKDWQLSEDQYLEWIIGYLDAAKLDKVVVVGCSMGAAIGLALMAKYPSRVLAGLLLETPYHSPGRRSPFLNHPEVHGGRLASAWVGSLLSPTSSPQRRALAGWIYAQGGPGIYDGDLAFYSDAFQAVHHTSQIDCQETPLWLFTGDYDYSASPKDTARVASEIAGAHFATLPGFGHFPMVENPEELWAFLEEPLAAIKRRLAV